MKLKSMIYLLMEKALSPCTDKIVCISKAEKASAEREHIASEDKLELIPNGIDVEAVRNAVAKSRKELGIASDAFVVGMIGRLSPQKAPDAVLMSALYPFALMAATKSSHFCLRRLAIINSVKTSEF